MNSALVDYPRVHHPPHSARRALTCTCESCGALTDQFHMALYTLHSVLCPRPDRSIHAIYALVHSLCRMDPSPAWSTLLYLTAGSERCDTGRS